MMHIRVDIARLPKRRRAPPYSSVRERKYKMCRLLKHTTKSIFEKIKKYMMLTSSPDEDRGVSDDHNALSKSDLYLAEWFGIGRKK
jgi:hypothetical protein